MEQTTDKLPVTDPALEQEEELKIRARSDEMARRIIGIGIDDPKIFDRIATDQAIIRQKYGLPVREKMIESLPNYERFLLDLAKKKGVALRSSGEFSGLPKEEHPTMTLLGNYQAIVGDIKKTSVKEYLRSLVMLEHEIIHVLQGDGMPIELSEYEAYVAVLSPDYLREHPGNLVNLFGIKIHGSVEFWKNIHTAKKQQ